MNSLSPIEKKLFESFKKIQGNGAFAIGVRESLATNNIDEFRSIVRQLKEQDQTHKQGMEWLIGTENAELIRAI
jgi:hypothetical protein